MNGKMFAICSVRSKLDKQMLQGTLFKHVYKELYVEKKSALVEIIINRLLQSIGVTRTASFISILL